MIKNNRRHFIKKTALATGVLINPFENSLLLMIGLFSLSGGITNWIAIHMLFERIPFFYGSGVIPNRFNEFKIGIDIFGSWAQILIKPLLNLIIL